MELTLSEKSVNLSIVKIFDNKVVLTALTDLILKDSV